MMNQPPRSDKNLFHVPIETLLLSGLVITIIALLVISTLVGYNTDRLLTTSMQVENTKNVLLESEKVMSDYKDAINGSRSYILTGNLRSLNRYNEGKEQLQTHLNTLKELISDNQQQIKNVDSLAHYMDLRIDVSATAMQIKDNFGLDSSSRYLTRYQKENMLGEIRRLVGQIQQHENELLARRKAASQASIKLFKTIMLTALISVLTLLVIVTVTVRHTLLARRKAEKETRQLNQVLEQRVLERTEELQKNEQLFRALIENNADMMTMSTAEGKLLYCSPSVTKVLGYSQKDFFNRGPDFVHPDDAPGLYVAVSSIMDSPGKMVYRRLRLKHFNGQYRWCETTVHNLLHDPYVKSLVSNFRDIHDKKLAEEEIELLNTSLEQKVKERTAQLEAANKELEAFSYSVSHDLRAPLRAISGFARIFNEDLGPTLNDEGKRLLGIIRGNAERMGTLIDDLLTFSRLGRQSIKCVKTDMNQLVETVLGNIRNNMSYNAEIKVNTLQHVVADPGLLSIVFNNLICNAIKYSSKVEKPVIEVSSYVEDNAVVVKITDNGVGFDMEYKDKLFGVFQRLHSSDEFEGTGVGLAIVQRIIHKHGGKVWAEGTVNKGASFYFSLPLETDNS
jgi:PAS domain S-box-containing protein